MNRIVKLLTVAGVSLIVIAPMMADYVRRDSGPCPSGSVVNKWTSNVRYNNLGQPQSASGVDCNGVAWSKNFSDFFVGENPGSVEVETDITNQTAGDITVVSSEVVDLRIVNLQSGEWASSLFGNVPANTPWTISTTTLNTNSLYGVVVVYQNYPIDLLYFYH